MAFFRALETMEPPSRRLFTDPYAPALLEGPLRTLARVARYPFLGSLVRRILEFGWPYTRSSGVVRTRAIDDLVTEAICVGAGQLVLLGAGFDSRAWRLQEAQQIAVFEVDHPATQRAKRERLNAAAGKPGSKVQFVPVDFEKGDFGAKLTAAGFDPRIPTVVVWEGVVSYLTKPSVERNLDLLARLLAPASRLVFTYMDQGAIDGSKSFPGARRWRSWVRFSGEPFIFGFDPDTLADTLRLFGFVLRSDESTRDIAPRYCEPIGRREPASQAYRVATADRAEG